MSTAQRELVFRIGTHDNILFGFGPQTQAMARLRVATVAVVYLIDDCIEDLMRYYPDQEKMATVVAQCEARCLAILGGKWGDGQLPAIEQDAPPRTYQGEQMVRDWVVLCEQQLEPIVWQRTRDCFIECMRSYTPYFKAIAVHQAKQRYLPIAMYDEHRSYESLYMPAALAATDRQHVKVFDFDRNNQSTTKLFSLLCGTDNEIMSYAKEASSFDPKNLVCKAMAEEKLDLFDSHLAVMQRRNELMRALELTDQFCTEAQREYHARHAHTITGFILLQTNVRSRYGWLPADRTGHDETIGA